MMVRGCFSRRARIVKDELWNFVSFVQFALSLLSALYFFPEKVREKRLLLSAHVNDKNTRKGTAKKILRDEEYDDGICYIDASMTPSLSSSSSLSSFEKGGGGGGVSVYYSPGHRLNFAAAVSKSSCKDSNGAEMLAFLACILRHDWRERLTVYTDSRYVLKAAESFRNQSRGGEKRNPSFGSVVENVRDGNTRWYLRCVCWALLSREGRTVVHKVKAHAEGNANNGSIRSKKNQGGGSYTARMNNARADALANFGAKSSADVFQNLGSFWGIVVAMYRFAGARRRGRGEEAPSNSTPSERRGRYEDDEEDEEEKEEREYYDRMAKRRPFGLGALRVVRNGRIINLFDAEEEDKERKQREVRSGPPIPLNDDFSITDCLALDCEMVGVGLGGVKSVLGQVSVINEHLNVVYTSYCRPTETVTDYRTQWSGLTEVHLRDAPSFEEVQNKVVELFGSGGTDGRRKIIMTGHGLENDLEVLRMTYPKELLRDTATWKPILRPPHFKKPQKLRKLVKIHCNFSIQRTTTTNETNGETTSKSVLGHDPSEDARGSMVLYLKFKSRWEHDIATRGVLRANIASSRFR